MLTAWKAGEHGKKRKRVSSRFILQHDMRGFICRHSDFSPMCPTHSKCYSINMLSHSLSISAAKAEEQDRCLYGFPFPLCLIHTLRERMKEAYVSLRVLEMKERKRLVSLATELLER